MRPGQENPGYSDQKKIINLRLEIPFLALNEEMGEEDTNHNIGDESYLRNMIQISHESWRSSNWSHLKKRRSQIDTEHILSASILSQ